MSVTTEAGLDVLRQARVDLAPAAAQGTFGRATIDLELEVPRDAGRVMFAFTVEPTRVEQSTNYDRLVLDIETDGSISPREALASSGATLRALVQLVEEMSDEPQGLEIGEVAVAAVSSPDLDLAIEDLDLSERPRNCLKRAQVNTVGELLQKSEDDLLAITNFGQKSLDEIKDKLTERGLSLQPSTPD